MYYLGQGVEQNYSEAYDYYESVSAFQMTVCACLIGVLYQNGHGVDQDYTKAMEYYRKASRDKLKPVYRFIGDMYEKGLGVDVDIEEAKKWHDLAGPLEDLYEELSPYFLMEMNGYAEKRIEHLKKVGILPLG